MKLKYTYTECYRILGISHGCTWNDLRKAYKLQIQKWHPDRYAENSPEKISADEKIKHVTAAYQQIASYYRKHNCLPDIEQPRLEIKHNEQNPSHTQKAQQYSSQTESRSKNNDLNNTFKSKSTFFPYFVSITIILTISYSIFYHATESVTSATPGPASLPNTKQKPVAMTDTTSPTIEPRTVTPTVENKTENLITYGSTISDVIGIQGIPTAQAGDTWYYGEDEVHFYAGTVVGWKRSKNSVLKVSLSQQIDSESDNQSTNTQKPSLYDIKNEMINTKKTSH